MCLRKVTKKLALTGDCAKRKILKNAEPSLINIWPTLINIWPKECAQKKSLTKVDQQQQRVGLPHGVPGGGQGAPADGTNRRPRQRYRYRPENTRGNIRGFFKSIEKNS